VHRSDPQPHNYQARLPWLLVVALAAALAAQYWLSRAPADRRDAAALESQHPIRFRLALPEGVSVAEGRSPAIAIAPQNDQIVFQGTSKGVTQLYRQRVDALEATAIAGTAGATDAAFSPDGKALAFFADGTLQRISADGGIASPLAQAANPRGLTWGVDDFIYLSPVNNSGILRVPARGGKPETVTSLADGQLSHRWPQLTADGSALLYTVWNDNGWSNTQIIWHPLDGSPAREIARGGGFARHIAGPDGRELLILVNEQTLLSAPLERSGAAITLGKAEPRLDNLFTNLSGGAHLAISPSGSMVYVGGRGAAAPKDVMWIDRDGTREPAGTLPATSRLSELSPGLEPAATAPLLITPPGIAWSPAGDAVAFASGDPTNLYRVPIAKPEAIERLTTNTYAQAPASWTPDGRTIAYEELDPLSGSDLWLATLDDQQRWTSRPFSRSPFNEVSPMVSPDGRWLAYASNESGRFETYVQPFPSGGRAIQVSTEGGAFPRWSPTGRDLFFMEVNGPGGVAVVPFTNGQVSLDRIHHIPGTRTPDRAYAVSRDGRRVLLALEHPQTSTATDIVVVAHWIAELTAQGRPH
jgi:Tol biopolymer transport system component